MIVKTRMQRERERHEAKAAVLIAQAARSAHEKTLRYGERSTRSPRTPRHTRGLFMLRTTVDTAQRATSCETHCTRSWRRWDFSWKTRH